MGRAKPIDDILAELDQVIRVWETRPAFTMGDITLVSAKAQAADLRARRAATESTRTLLTEQVNDQNAAAADSWQSVIRIRGGIRASFGPDSSEYEQAGGTRTSERKKPKKKKT